MGLPLCNLAHVIEKTSLIMQGYKTPLKQTNNTHVLCPSNIRPISSRVHEVSIPNFGLLNYDYI